MPLYYQDDYVTLFHGDCLKDHREWLAADVLVTDPPYGIAWAKHGGGTGYTQSVKHEGIQNDKDTSVRDGAIAAFGDKPGIVFGSFRAPFPADVKQTLVWQKPIDAGVLGSTTGYRTDTELIFLTGRHLEAGAWMTTRGTNERQSVTNQVIPEAAAFVKPASRARFDANQKAVRDADWREYVQKVIGDAMKATAGA